MLSPQAESLHTRLIHAEEDFLAAIAEGPEAVESFETTWTSLCNEIIASITSQHQDEHLISAAREVWSRIALYAASFHDLYLDQEELSRQMMSALELEFSHLSLKDCDDHSPLRGSKLSPAEKKAGYLLDELFGADDLDSAGYVWLLGNLHNPYPSKYIKDAIARSCRVSSRKVARWFEDARLRIGWTTLCKRVFNSSRSTIVDAAISFYLHQSHTSLPPDVVTDFAQIRDSVVHLSQCTADTGSVQRLEVHQFGRTRTLDQRLPSETMASGPSQCAPCRVSPAPSFGSTSSCTSSSETSDDEYPLLRSRRKRLAPRAHIDDSICKKRPRIQAEDTAAGRASSSVVDEMDEYPDVSSQWSLLSLSSPEPPHSQSVHIDLHTIETSSGLTSACKRSSSGEEDANSERIRHRAKRLKLDDSDLIIYTSTPMVPADNVCVIGNQQVTFDALFASHVPVDVQYFTSDLHHAQTESSIQCPVTPIQPSPVVTIDLSDTPIQGADADSELDHVLQQLMEFVNHPTPVKEHKLPSNSYITEDDWATLDIKGLINDVVEQTENDTRYTSALDASISGLHVPAPMYLTKPGADDVYDPKERPIDAMESSRLRDNHDFGASAPPPFEDYAIGPYSWDPFADLLEQPLDVVLGAPPPPYSFSEIFAGDPFDLHIGTLIPGVEGTA